VLPPERFELNFERCVFRYICMILVWNTVFAFFRLKRR
jgi:hypothetical protein